jgi:hypothetical protein
MPRNGGPDPSTKWRPGPLKRNGGPDPSKGMAARTPQKEWRPGPLKGMAARTPQKEWRRLEGAPTPRLLECRVLLGDGARPSDPFALGERLQAIATPFPAPRESSGRPTRGRPPRPAVGRRLSPRRARPLTVPPWSAKKRVGHARKAASKPSPSAPSTYTPTPAAAAAPAAVSRSRRRATAQRSAVVAGCAMRSGFPTGHSSCACASAMYTSATSARRATRAASPPSLPPRGGGSHGHPLRRGPSEGRSPPTAAQRRCAAGREHAARRPGVRSVHHRALPWSERRANVDR